MLPERQTALRTEMTNEKRQMTNGESPFFEDNFFTHPSRNTLEKIRSTFRK